jgi:hypothetical protein
VDATPAAANLQYIATILLLLLKCKLTTNDFIYRHQKFVCLVLKETDNDEDRIQTKKTRIRSLEKVPG